MVPLLLLKRMSTQATQAETKKSSSHLFSLIEGTDVTGTVENIRGSVPMKGINVWMLLAAAFLACIGLDTNSTAVIIGAMLVSPLMSPILGIGLSVAINDRPLLTDALKNFGIAILLSLLISTTYFLISPLGEVTGELTARTAPTLLDVAVAFFGGVAGILAGSRREKTTALPGVAIATALMPPLCTAGFGLATGRFNYFLGAFYLFFINAVFISLATYMIVVLLKFPHVEFADAAAGRKIRRLMILFSTIVIIPSLFIFYGVITELRVNKQIQGFIAKKINSDKRNALRWDLLTEGAQSTLRVYLFGEPINAGDTDKLKADLASYGLGHMQLKLIQTSVPQAERQRLFSELETSVLEKLITIQQAQNSSEAEKENRISALELELRQHKGDPLLLENLRNELNIIFPGIQQLIYTPGASLSAAEPHDPLPVMIVVFEKPLAARKKREIHAKLEQLLKQRLQLEAIKLVLE